MARPPYDPMRDFEAVSLLGTATILMVVHPSVPARSVAEFIAHAKTRPDQMMFGSTGNGSVSHLTAEYFKSTAGIDLQHVPYKGDSPLTVQQRMQALGIQIAGGSPDAFAGFLRSEGAKWGRIVRASGAKVD